MASLFAAHLDYLHAKIHIEFCNDAQVDMIGGYNTGSSYSLPDHIMLSLPALPENLRGRLREIQQLEILVEGKAEYFDQEGRYTPFRLFRETIDLSGETTRHQIPSEDPNNAQSRQITVAIPFDLRLPGWLPASQALDLTATSYGVMAKARLGWTSPFMMVPRKSSSNRSLASYHTTYLSSEFTRFSIQRHRRLGPVAGLAPERQERHFALKPETKDFDSPVECVVTVPDWVDVNGEEKSLKVSLRLRAKRPAAIPETSTPRQRSTTPSEGSDEIDMLGSVTELDPPESDEPTRDRSDSIDKAALEDPIYTKVVELGMEVEESERYSSAIAPTFLTAFPIPVAQPSQDGSEHPLIEPAPQAYLARTGENPDLERFRGERLRPCLLADDGSQRNFWFAGEGLELGDKWRKINIVLPMPAESRSSKSTRPKADHDGPFMRIKHSLKIRVVCKNVDSDGKAVSVILSTPIRFGTSLLTLPRASSTTQPSLPAYVQLFHENGDLRQCDPLPLYSGPIQVAAPVISSHAPPSPSSTPHRISSSKECLSSSPFPIPSYDSLFPRSRAQSPLTSDFGSSLADAGQSHRRVRADSPSGSSGYREDVESKYSSSAPTLPNTVSSFSSGLH
ncbi:hypothetical protein BD324DRAFT_631851 [Kockovaella imperatae]|uniref:Uncharacterized protein n=1 Tax=Kockovaella imperatae TaxID=4999 RepID=A0A1Y1UCG3_9TREE|nr:hypothetical protein BD324DRAFT_631851 [Kockovaella imperatae]ORX35217.1 hypothetical protein BD324DRAFT_631851 [Kockovaella imperatae]